MEYDISNKVLTVRKDGAACMVMDDRHMWVVLGTEGELECLVSLGPEHVEVKCYERNSGIKPREL